MSREYSPVPSTHAVAQAMEDRQVVCSVGYMVTRNYITA